MLVADLFWIPSFVPTIYRFPTMPTCLGSLGQWTSQWFSWNIFLLCRANLNCSIDSGLVNLWSSLSTMSDDWESGRCDVYVTFIIVFCRIGPLGSFERSWASCDRQLDVDNKLCVLTYLPVSQCISKRRQPLDCWRIQSWLDHRKIRPYYYHSDGFRSCVSVFKSDTK